MNDRARVQNAIIPMMIFNMINNIIEEEPTHRKFYEQAMFITKETSNLYLEDLNKKIEAQRHKRLIRISKKIHNYFADNKYDTRKGLLVLTLWAFYLDKKDLLEIYAVEYFELLKELQETFKVGFKEVDNFEKIYKSAEKQMMKVHAIATKEGYF